MFKKIKQKKPNNQKQQQQQQIYHRTRFVFMLFSAAKRKQTHESRRGTSKVGDLRRNKLCCRLQFLDS